GHATHARIVIESKPEPTKKKTSSISTRGVVIQDTPSALKPKPTTLKLKLKGVQSLTPEEQEAANIIRLCYLKFFFERQISATSSEGTENESEHLEDSQLNSDEEEKKDNNGDADDEDEDDDHISDIQDTDDEDAKIESESDEIYNYKIQVHKDVDVEMVKAETVECENKEKDEMTDAAKADAKKTVEEKGDAELDGNAMTSNYQVKESTEFPMPYSSSFVSSRFETPQIQSPSLLKVPVLVLPETTTLPPIPEIPTKTPVSTALSPPHVTATILIVQQTTTLIPTPPITTEALTITTTVLESDALTVVQLR
ncbi:hypothetical protein Tco_0030344, partial [Tanacetum coccineum]